MRKVLPAILSVLVLVSALPATAGGLEAGNRELAASAWYVDMDIDDASFKMTNLTGQFGWAFADGHELEVLVGYWKIDLDGWDVDGLIWGLGYTYNFSTEGNVVPFLGVEVAKIDGDLGDLYDMTWGAVGGIKVYPWEHGGFRVGVRWGKMNSNMDGLSDADLLGLDAGVVLRF